MDRRPHGMGVSSLSCAYTKIAERAVELFICIIDQLFWYSFIQNSPMISSMIAQLFIHSVPRMFFGNWIPAVMLFTL